MCLGESRIFGVESCVCSGFMSVYIEFAGKFFACEIHGVSLCVSYTDLCLDECYCGMKCWAVWSNLYGKIWMNMCFLEKPFSNGK